MHGLSFLTTSNDTMFDMVMTILSGLRTKIVSKVTRLLPVEIIFSASIQRKKG